MAKNYDDFVLPNQEALWITGLPLKTKYGFIRPSKIKSYSRYAVDFEFLKLQGFEIKNIIKKECKGSPTEELIKEMLDGVSFIQLVRNNFWKLRDRYNTAFGNFIEDFDTKQFETMQQIEFDELRELILKYNGIQFYRKSQDPIVEKFRFYQRVMATKNSSGAIEFDSVYSLLMTQAGGGHKPHDINDFTILQFYSAFNSIQNQKNHDATILFKTIDPKIDIVEYFTSVRAKEENGKSYSSIDAIRKDAPIKL